jgi:hypothetical protein
MLAILTGMVADIITVVSTALADTTTVVEPTIIVTTMADATITAVAMNIMTTIHRMMIGMIVIATNG